MGAKNRKLVFVSDLGECTDFFKENEIQRAVDLTYSGGIVNVYANSNFGRAFRQFAERHLEAVTSKTTVIVIGDTENDVLAAKANGAVAIAVATGTVPIERLEASGADVVLKTLEGAEKVLLRA